MSDRVHNVLFVCTHNSARSIMAEGLLNSELMFDLPLQSLDKMSIQREIKDIGTR